MKIKNMSILTALLVLGVSSACAMEYKTLGVKSISMGGASVASKPDSTSVFNNPALLAQPTHTVEISFGGGLGVTDNKLGASIQALEDIDFVNKMDNFDLRTATISDIDSLKEGRRIAMNMNGNSMNIAPEAYFGVQIKQFGFGVFGYGDINAQAKISQAHNALIVENSSTPGVYINLDTGSASSSTNYQNTSIEYAINNNLTYLGVTGLAVAEVPVGYGRQFSTPAGNFSVGASLKYMYGTTYTDIVSVSNADFADNIDQRKVVSSTFGIDIGTLYEPTLIPSSRIGLVAKNINTPEFATWNNKIKIEPQFRLGLAYDIFESLEIAMDVDLTENKTLVDTLKSQMIGGGLNFHPASWTSLRAGLKQNISSTSNNAPVYTAGVSLGLKWFQIDVAGQYSSATNEISGNSIPEEAKVNLALVSKW